MDIANFIKSYNEMLLQYFSEMQSEDSNKYVS